MWSPFLFPWISVSWELQQAVGWNLICWQGGDHITHKRLTSSSGALETIQRSSRCTLVLFRLHWFSRECVTSEVRWLDTVRLQNTADWPHTIASWSKLTRLDPPLCRICYVAYCVFMHGFDLMLYSLNCWSNIHMKYKSTTSKHTVNIQAIQV